MKQVLVDGGVKLEACWLRAADRGVAVAGAHAGLSICERESHWKITNYLLEQ